MEVDALEKVDVSRVVIQRIADLPSKARVSSLEAANAVLESWANGVDATGNDECDLQIVFEDGFRYHEHYRLKKTQKRISLARHVRKQLTALASLADAGKATQSVDDPVISQIGADQAESAKLALDHYNI